MKNWNLYYKALLFKRPYLLSIDMQFLMLYSMDDRDNHEVSCAHGLTVRCSCAASKLFLIVDLAKTVGPSSSGKTVLE